MTRPYDPHDPGVDPEDEGIPEPLGDEEPELDADTEAGSEDEPAVRIKIDEDVEDDRLM
ncbi:hypothetical protein [Streptomyces jeddahensis]|uniref:Uncharacterized protein n=1 Tax=Streptomyces jeddahensis TaxID=1716141 RepID=A0A177HN65_9ACTN|nr:hypothetical protein [Streptomyces jeddahensis]OAH12040.1 hypothetical protein STSP_46150 [Streptomyces jeddahensis]